MLVPIDQISEDFIRPADRTDFPESFTQDLFSLLDRTEQRLRLLDVLARRGEIQHRADAWEILVSGRSAAPNKRD
jgi:hypothetical protein